MPVRLVAGAEGEAAWQALVEADRALFRIPAHESDARFLRGYCQWVVDQMRIMRSLIALHHVDELIVTPLCAVLQAAGSGVRDGSEAPHLRLLTSAEIEERHRALSRAATGLRCELDTWSAAGTLVVPDTNVFLHHRHDFEEISWSSFTDSAGPTTVVVPMIVVQELDRLKRSNRDQVRSRARVSLSRIEALFAGRRVEDERPRPGASGSARLRVLTDPLGHRPHERADDEIISQAVTVQGWAGRPVTLITFDTNMAFTARQADLTVVKLSQTDEREEVGKPRGRLRS